MMIPLAIVVAGVIVAGSLFVTRNGENTNNPINNNPEDVEISILPVSEKDHILGNPDADIVIVEFSDLECPFCKQYHSTLNTIIDEYGKDGKVAWIYRHFPIASLHSKAQKEAEATECAAELGGNNAFWKYINRLFEITPSNNGLDLAKLPEIAEEVGLDRAKFEECLESGRTANLVQDQFNDGVSSGARGTPHSVFLVKGQEPAPLSGAVSLEQLRGIIDQTLLNL